MTSTKRVKEVVKMLHLDDGNITTHIQFHVVKRTHGHSRQKIADANRLIFIGKRSDNVEKLVDIDLHVIGVRKESFSME